MISRPLASPTSPKRSTILAFWSCVLTVESKLACCKNEGTPVLTSAHLDARNMLLIVAKRTIYMRPYDRLINAETREINANVLVIGSFAASGT